MRALAEAYRDEPIVQQLVAQIPWGHNVRILDIVRDYDEPLWYIQQTIENGWSRSVLEYQISSKLYQRQGKAITNPPSFVKMKIFDLSEKIKRKL